MKKFTPVTATVLPLDRSNVDTDAIIPKQFLKSIKRSGFGPNLFDQWRYLDQGEPGMDCRKRPLNPDFILNQERYKAVEILLARENFGCGSSREHAPWALEDYGFKVIIAPSFADIFFNNCFKNGLLPIVLDVAQVDYLFVQALSTEGYALTVNLEQQEISVPGQANIKFEVDEFQKYCLINGLDDIGLTLQHTDMIKAYEQKRVQSEPWIIN